MTKSQVANLAFVNNSVYVKTFSTFDKKLLIIIITIWDIAYMHVFSVTV